MAPAAAGASDSELVRLENVSHHLGQGASARQVLYEVSLSIQPGEVTILSGPSGSGKTTALTLIGALRRAQAGSLRVLGEELVGASSAARVAVRRRIGFVFQQHNLLGSLTRSRTSRWARAARLRRRGAWRRAEAIAAAAGYFGARGPSASGGQRQRVAVPRLVSEPRLILADEPTASGSQVRPRGGRDPARWRGARRVRRAGHPMRAS
jgi:putative ABC transport system ATP-binding protein